MIRVTEVEGVEVKVGVMGKIIKPTVALYPYDAVRGWQDLNMARSVYHKNRMVKVMHIVPKGRR